MQKSGRIVFSQMDEVLFGKPAAEAIADEARRLAADRIFLMVSGTLAPPAFRRPRYWPISP
jgi:maleylacetate reductase